MRATSSAALFLEPLVKAMKAGADARKAASMAAYMLNQFSFLGLPAPQRDALVLPFVKQNRLSDAAVLEAAVLCLWQKEEREFQYAAIDLLAQNKKCWTKATIHLMIHCLVHQSWWDTVDGMGSDWLPAYFQLFPEQVKPITGSWNQSENIWLVRSSILFQKKYKAKTDLDLLAAYILPHLSSGEFFIQKAIGWALREQGKTHPDWVRSFVAQNKMAPLSKREALKRL